MKSDGATMMGSGASSVRPTAGDPAAGIPSVLWLEMRDPVLTTRTGIPAKIVRATEDVQIVPVTNDSQRAFPGDPTAFLIVTKGERLPMRICRDNVGSFQFGHAP